ncbi:polymeric immunoglobulin receptor-like, partial [Danio aesculapii]|uniref:polymeric immunoglobulin receptor-like n=1 Tax=Danio aesculapii TaxID=1142201 RepID=UPI0024C02584
LGAESYICWSSCTITVQPGGSVTIPCYYDEKYTPQKKYWNSGTDQSSTFTNTTEENLSIIDHPDQSLFTVIMKNLQEKHTGRYYCVVETGEDPSIKDIYEPYLQVQAAPDMSVMSSSVSAHEGSNVSVQCFYSSEYQNKLKRWCRYKDKSCFTEEKTDISQNSSVQISDVGESSFIVLMTGLRHSDSGWYFCSAGERIIPVQLTVTEAKPTHGVFVKSSSVSGLEGGSASVQCFYSDIYRNALKQWCRIKDKSCYPVERSQNQSVQISDDGENSFTVLMTRLRLSDSGWYFCSVGDLQVHVQLTVTKPRLKGKITNHKINVTLNA